MENWHAFLESPPPPPQLLNDLIIQGWRGIMASIQCQNTPAETSCVYAPGVTIPYLAV